MDVFFVFLLLFTEIVLLGVAWLIFEGDFISPSIVTLILFILSTACFAYNTNDWDVVFTFKAYTLFLLSFVLMIATEKWMSRHRVVIRKKSYHENGAIIVRNSKEIFYIPRPFDSIFLLIFITCAVYYVYRVYKSGMALGATGILTSIGFNKEEGDYDGVSRMLYNLVRVASYAYVIMFCNNVFNCKEGIKKNWKSLVIIILTTLITFFSGQRSVAICFIAGIIVASGIALNDAKKNGLKVNHMKFLFRLIFIAAAVVLVFYLSSNIVKGTTIQRQFIDYITYYFGSTTALMGRIVEEPELCHTPFAGYFGEKTFNGFWANLNSWGIVNEEPCKRLWIKLGGAITTRAGNEYTFLCGPYIDFGFGGTLLFIVFFYAVFSYIYYWKIKKKELSIRKLTISAVYIFLYAMVAMSFYQDTIRSYSRPINIIYIVYIVVFCKLFIKIKDIRPKD